MRDAERQAQADEPGFLASSVTTLRLICGWAATALALLNLSMGTDTGSGTTDASYLLFHAVLLLTGLVLLGWRRVRRVPGLAGALAGGLVAGLGLVLSTVPSTSVVCCLSEFPVRHGFPFTMFAKGSGGWQTDGLRLIADVFFWAGAGFLVLVVVSLLRGSRSSASPPRHASEQIATHDTAYTATHSEEHATRTRTPQDENVGGLP
jgi:hypothetical protein